MSDLNKRFPKPEAKRQPIIRYAKTPEEILAASYVVPKEQAPDLLVRAMKELYPGLDIDFDESVEMSIQVLQKVNEILKR